MSTGVSEQQAKTTTAFGAKANTRAKTRKSRLGCAECKLKRVNLDDMDCPLHVLIEVLAEMR